MEGWESLPHPPLRPPNAALVAHWQEEGRAGVLRHPAFPCLVRRFPYTWLLVMPTGCGSQSHIRSGTKVPRDVGFQSYTG